MPNYTVRQTKLPEKLICDWSAPSWQIADIIQVDHFRPESGTHRPRTRARLLYDDSGIHGIFHVNDRYVRSVRQGFQSEVWKDSCVEFFVQPKAGHGYFNFEFNCGGSFLCNYITNHERAPGGFKAFQKLSYEVARGVRVTSTMPPVVEPEIELPTEWTLKFFVPFSVLEHFVGDVDRPNARWRGNLFKCGDETSHPHWASWAPVDELNFHLPQCFGSLIFE